MDAEKIIQVVCRTLMHSLWQGLLLAVVAGVIILATKKSRPLVRYHLLTSLFFLFLLASGYTFSRQVRLQSETVTEHAVAANRNAPFSAMIIKSDHPAVQFDIRLLFSRIADFADRHAAYVVGCWLLILAFRFVKLITGMVYTYRIRRYQVQFPGHDWQLKLNALAERLQIKKKVLLLESALTRIPVMTGFFRPVILFPLGLLTQLPPDEIEAVLLHELAHIKRNDYLINLAQHVAETFFFFNPGVLWLSSLIRDERENCCDDMAVGESNRKKDFLRALVFFQEYKYSDTKTALAFPGSRNHLLNRIKRIITNNNKTLNNMEKISLLAAMLLTGIATIAFRSTQPHSGINKVKNMSASYSPAVERDTVPEPSPAAPSKHKTQSSVNTTIDGKTYRLEESNQKVTGFYVDGQKVADDKLADYQQVIDRIHKELKESEQSLKVQQEKLAMEQSMLALQQQQLNKVLIEKAQADLDDAGRRKEFDEKQEMDELKRKQEQLYKMQPDMLHQQRLLEKKKQEMLQQLAELVEKQNALMAGKQMMLKRDDFSLMPDADAPDLALQKVMLDRSPMITPDGAFPSPPSPGMKRERIMSDIRSANSEDVIGSIVADLVGDHIIRSSEVLSFSLDAKTFNVNNESQPRAIQEKYRERYIRNKKDHISYSVSPGNTSTNISIQKEK